MKKLTRSLVFTAALALAVLPGCALAPTPAAPAVVVVAPLVPPAVRAKLVALVSRHPEARPYLVSVANALTSIAAADQKLPDPNGTLATLLQWTTLIPQVGSYVADFMAIYREAYPALTQSGAVLSEIAEIVRAGTTVTP